MGQLLTVYAHVLTIFTQTLTHVNLRETQITDNGAQHLAEALKTNKVTSIDLLSLAPYISFPSSFYRHYRLYIWNIITIFLLLWRRVWNNKTDECALIDYFILLRDCNKIEFYWIDSLISARIEDKQFNAYRRNWEITRCVKSIVFFVSVSQKCHTRELKLQLKWRFQLKKHFKLNSIFKHDMYDVPQ